MPDPTPENVDQVLKDIETATKEVEDAEKQKVPDYGLGEYNAPIAEAIQNVKNINEKNQKSADEIAEMLGQVLSSMPPEKSQQIFREVYADILKDQKPFTDKPENHFEEIFDDAKPEYQPNKIATKPVAESAPEGAKKQEEIENKEKDFIKKQRECLVYVDELAKTKNVSLLLIRENVMHLRHGDKEKTEYLLWQLNDAVTITKRLTQKEANTIAEMLGI